MFGQTEPRERRRSWKLRAPVSLQTRNDPMYRLGSIEFIYRMLRWINKELTAARTQREMKAKTVNLLVLLHGGGQRKSVRQPGDHREQHHLRRCSADPPRPSKCSGELAAARAWQLVKSDNTARDALSWPETPQLSVQQPNGVDRKTGGTKVPAEEFRPRFKRFFQHFLYILPCF